MKLTIALFLFLSVPLTAFAVREVEFEWEEVEGARHYQVEIKNNQSFLQKLTSDTPTFKTKITPGKYQIRGKVHGIDPRDTQSDWSSWKEFDIPPTKVESLKLDKFEHKVSPQTYLSHIPIKWNAIDGATEYVIEVSDINQKKTKTFTSKGLQGVLKLRPGYYNVKITAKTADGLPSEPYELPQPIVVQNIPVAAPEKIQVEPEKGLLTFSSPTGAPVVVSLERQPFLGQGWKKLDQKAVSGSTYNWQPNLTPGKYRLTLFSKNSFNEVSTPVTREFEVKPKEQDLPP